MIYFEDIQNEINRVFGKDADIVDIVQNGTSFDITIEEMLDGFTISDWSEMDQVEELYQNWVMEKCGSEG